MGDPSEYELAAWDAIQRFQGRPLSQGIRWVGEKAANGAAAVGVSTAEFLEEHPKAEMVVSRGKELVAEGARVVGSGFHRAAGALPDWSGVAFASVRQTVGRVSRAGLSPKRVVARHKKHQHPVASLADLRRLDLEQIDEVRGRGASWYYPALAALSGAGAGLVISGGELVVTVSAGVAAAPSGGAIVGSLAGDAAIVLGLSSRVVGEVALHYGYDPEDPAEKLFVMSIVNAGSAMSGLLHG